MTYEGVERLGRHEPLIDESLFSRVAAVLRSHSLAGERDRVHFHYLRGSLYCGRCSSRLVYSLARGRAGGHYPYFFCIGRQRRNGGDLPYVRVAAAEDAVTRLCMQIELQPEEAPRLRARLVERLKSQQAELARDAEVASGRLQRLETERLSLLQAYYAGAVPVDLLKREQDRLQTELDNARGAIAAASAKATNGERVITLAVEIGADCGLAYLQASESERRDFNQAFFEKVYLDADRDSLRADFTPAFADVLQHPSGDEDERANRPASRAGEHRPLSLTGGSNTNYEG